MMSDNRKNNGGKRLGSGRKPKGHIEKLIKNLSPLEPLVIEALSHALKKREKWAIKLLVQYFSKYILSDDRAKSFLYKLIECEGLNNNECKDSSPNRKYSKCYIMKDCSTGYYKIGKSVNPKYRERTLQSEKPSIVLVKVFNYDHESELHEIYKNQRVRGEWFELMPAQVRFICSQYH